VARVKRLIARQIHIESDRADKPFIEINSANLTEDKIRSGTIRQSLTEDSFIQGKFEQADGGTVFFDEISSLGTEIQAKLLEVIDTNRFVKIRYFD
jgi:DNA-binding NtrC family response regulator